MIPILMYHKVGEPVRSRGDRFLNVSARSFERQIRMLRRFGYRGVTFAQAAEGLWQGRPLPRKAICITFDDGYENVAEHAAPILAAAGWPGTVFVPTAYVGGANTWDEANGKPVLPIMGWDRLRALAGAGWEIAGHTRAHPALDSLDDGSALAELGNGKSDIESHLGVQVRTFCYPFGRIGPRTPELVRQVGFLAACTTRSGLARADSDPALLPRVKIAYRDGVPGLFYRLVIRSRLA